ncbi:MAG TPA: hypothetical protein DGH68_12405 [Bacteroidetes bacterium]|jgi:hypothetical protein|nr:hypothetical protein [Bacteroidota bacterium]
MARTSIIWVHGNTAEPEQPESLMRFARKGWGAQCQGMSGTTHWFHFPIASPSVLEGSPMYLSKLYVMYNTMPGGKAELQPVITNVHVYDGRTLAMSFDDLSLSGVHDELIEAANTLVINPALRIANGLGLSVGVQFPLREGEESISYDILFTAAGAEFAS